MAKKESLDKVCKSTFTFSFFIKEVASMLKFSAGLVGNIDDAFSRITF